MTTNSFIRGGQRPFHALRRHPDLRRRSWLAAVLLAAAGAAGAVDLRLEGGPTRILANDVQRPKTDDGTRFDGRAYSGRHPTPWRLELTWADEWWQREGQWQLTVAPLRARGEGVAATDLRFGGSTFLAGQPVSMRYRFDTYRASYTEPFGRSWSGDWHWRAGGVLAIRNASIRLQQGATSRRFDNVGPVPLARVEVSREFFERQRLTATFEGFPAPGGGGLFDGAVRWDVQLAPTIDAGLYVREQAGAAVDRAILNRLHVRSAGLSLTAHF